jgi:hypothetical protein
VQTLSQLGADSATIYHLERLAVVQDIYAVAGSFPQKLTDPSLISSLHNAAQALDPIAATGTSLTATAGAPFSGIVATFADASWSHAISNYVATITWGDGNSSPGTIMATAGGGFNVIGNDTYASPGSYAVSVQIVDATGHTATAGSTANVTDLSLGVQRGQTAGIGFWHNQNGQALIQSFNGGGGATALANWLALTFPNIYGALSGNNLTGATNAQVGAFYLNLFARSGPRLDAQVLAMALNVYATTQSLGGTAGQAYGFTVTDTGLGARSYNVGCSGAAFDAANNATLNVYQILRAANKFALVGVLYNGNRSLVEQAIAIFDDISQAGDI